jgi:general secretion pathway protein H
VTAAGQRGFTLIELLVALAVIGLIAALVIPRLDRLAPGYDLRASADVLRADLRRARSEAMRSNRESWVLIDVAEGAWRREGDGQARKAPPDARLAIVVAMRERLDESRGRVRFYPDGTSTGGSATLSGDGRVYRVEVDWFDGRVSVDETVAR